jgi:hypothetical protein
MDNYEWHECELSDFASVKAYLENFSQKQKELVLLSGEETVGAILTKEQYAWFLEQIDKLQNVDFIAERKDDLHGAQSLQEMKKELGC